MIKVGIVGYGNLGKGVEKAITQNDDLELVAVFTRRNPEQMVAEGTEARFEHISAAEQYIGKIDVMILCGVLQRICQSRHLLLLNCSIP